MFKEDKTIEWLGEIRPGAAPYRAYVGPPERYDLIGLSQLGLLYTFNLKESDKVLDFGCGSLRAGRMLIPFLREGGYFGIDPNRWLIDDGIKYELGQDIIKLKKPKFSYDENFDCGVFDVQFDFIIAQSIISHAGPALAKLLFDSASRAIQKDGLFLLTYKRGVEQASMPVEGWCYPNNIEYAPVDILRLLKEAGFSAMEIPWYHPGQQWIAASLNSKRLPTIGDITMLEGSPIQRS